MNFPKPIMSTCELVEMGFPRRDLLCYAHRKNSPAHSSRGGGKFLYDTEKLQKLLDTEKNTKG